MSVAAAEQLPAAPLAAEDRIVAAEQALERLFKDRSIPSWSRSWYLRFYQAMKAQAPPGLDDLVRIRTILEAARDRAALNPTLHLM